MASVSTTTVAAGSSATVTLDPTDKLSVDGKGTISFTTSAGTNTGTNIDGATTFNPFGLVTTAVITAAPNKGVTYSVKDNAPTAYAENGRMLAPINSLAFDIFDLYKTSDRRSVSLDNPYSSLGADIVHPSCVFVPRGWNGWRYWMAYTPYPASNSNYENPCISVSNDGENWTVPSGLTNPLVTKPVGGYNADTHLVMSPDGSTMYLIYRERLTATTTNNIRVMESTNGSDWSAPVTIMTGSTSSQDYASPSIFYDNSNSRWVCISHNLDGGSTYPMQRFVTSGTSIYSGWGAASAITIANPTGGRTFWHSAFNILPDGRIVGLIQDIVNGGAGATGALFAAESLDGGITFSVRLVYATTNYYRPNFNLVTNDSGATSFIAWLGLSSGTWGVKREDWSVGNAAKQIYDGMVQSSAFGTYPSSWLWFDNFNRADGALGTPLVGSALTVDTGTFTIVSNKMQSGSVGNNRALATLTTADHVIETDFVTASAVQAWMVFRAADTSNYYRIGLTAGLPGTLTIQSIVGGGVVLNRAVVPPAEISASIAAGARVRVVCRGRRFRVYVNGVFWEEITDLLYYATGLKAGVQCTNAGVVFDNLLITS